jgi:hypothetical protein
VPSSLKRTDPAAGTEIISFSDRQDGGALQRF